jgi:L-aspartate oxidase
MGSRLAARSLRLRRGGGDRRPRANRLASNSLLEALVFGRRVAEDLVLSGPKRVPPPPAGRAHDATPRVERSEVAAALRWRLQDAMWRGAGVVRTEEGLLSLLAELDGLDREAPRGEDRAASELRNLIELGRLVALAALRRRESRGCHYRADRPRTEPALASRSRYRAEELRRDAPARATVVG